MNRRGFLSLVGFGAAAAAVEAALPSAVRAALLPKSGEHFAAWKERTTIAYLAFGPDVGSSLIVEPGDVVQLIAAPQRIFRPIKLAITGPLAPWELLQVNHHGHPELTRGVSAETFSVAAATSFPLCAAMPGEQIVLALRNVSTAVQNAPRAAMQGLALR